MKLLTTDNDDLMEIGSLEQEGDTLLVVGTIMGAMPVRAVLTPSELRSAFKLLDLKTIVFVISMIFRK